MLEHPRGVADLREQIDVTETIPLSPAEEPDRLCTGCATVKPASAFHSNGPGKRRPRCARCRSASRPRRLGPSQGGTPEQKRANVLKQKYGITPAQYDEMLARQGGGCAICEKPPRGNRLAVDHCHATGRVRALLCPACNRSIGYYEFVRAQAEAYLAAYGDGNPLLGYGA